MIKTNRKKGFTLAELLIVIGIISVLMAVAVPLFASELEKSKIATDHANIRSAHSLMSSSRAMGMIHINGVPTDADGKYYYAKDGTLNTDAADAYKLKIDDGAAEADCTLHPTTSHIDRHAEDAVIYIEINGASWSLHLGDVPSVASDFTYAVYSSGIGGAPTLWLGGETYISGFASGYAGTTDINIQSSSSDGNSVQAVGPSAFANSNLTSVSLPSSIRYIEKNAFKGNKLTKISLPAKLSYIGKEAFKNNELTKLTLTNEILAVYASAFENNQLEEVSIASSVLEIGANAFANNPNLKKITIHKSEGSITGAPWGANLNAIKWVE